MSEHYFIFIKSQYSLSEVSETLEEILNTSLKQSTVTNDEHYYGWTMGLGLNLFENISLEGKMVYEDFTFSYSEYNHEILFDIMNFFHRSDVDEWVTNFSTVLADELSARLYCECVVIRNSAAVLCRFAPKEEPFILNKKN